MDVSTTRFGLISVPEDSIYSFPSGILGFPEQKQFAIISENDGPLKWMQSLSSPDLAFVVCDPLTFKPDYQVKLQKSELSEIKLSEVSKAVVLVILVVRDDPQEITANLVGPLVFNTENQLAKQSILTEDGLSTKHKLIDNQVAANAS
ncbi:MAG: flagellar assembly protein FliW [Planctomycetota bacterium]|nr:MAG: flagellar assembly protein FliW [Planctomycetota bacterium]